MYIELKVVFLLVGQRHSDTCSAGVHEAVMHCKNAQLSLCREKNSSSLEGCQQHQNDRQAVTFPLLYETFCLIPVPVEFFRS